MVDPKLDTAAKTVRIGDGWMALIVGIVVVAIVLSFGPILGIPRNDDFSYARTAESLAHTGHIAYNGWGSPLMLPQALIGAFLIKLFGFSYSLLEAFGVFCAGAAVSTLFMLCRLVGLDRKACLFIVTVVVANPMFLCTAPTFMTDIPSLLLLLLALCALVRALRLEQGTADGSPALRLIPSRFWLSLLLGVVAGSNRQLSWIVYFGALIPIWLAVRSLRERLILIVGVIVLVAVAVAASLWLSHQPYTVPTDIVGGLILLFGYTEPILAVVYRYFFIFGLFLLPVALVSVQPSDLKRLWFWGALALTAAPLLFPLSLELGYFRNFYGAARSGQYFTSRGAAIGYITREKSDAQFISSGLLTLWVVLGVLALGISLFLLTEWVASVRRESRLKEAEKNKILAVNPLESVMASIFLASTLLEIAASFPWFAQLHEFDRYFLFYLPGFAIFFMLQGKMRVRRESQNRTFGRVRGGFAVICVVSMVLLSWAITATYTNLGRAQANLYHRLLARSVPPQQIDNGLEFDADAQVVIKGYINSKDMVPISAYDPNAIGHNIPSQTPGLFPVMDGHFIMSLIPDPELSFSVDSAPADSESYMSYLPFGRQTVYVLHVSN